MRRTSFVKRAPSRVPCHARRNGRTAILALSCCSALSLLAGCSSVSETLSPAKVDYRANAARTSTLEVPPDLTQLSADPRFQPPSGGSVSANTLSTTAAAPTAAHAGDVAPVARGGMRIERSGNVRWLVTSTPPEQLWPQLRSFWLANGFSLTIDQPELGVMETDWAENRARLPKGGTVQRMIAKALDGLRDSGERDLYRTRIERTAAGTEVYITHRGAIEEYTDSTQTQTHWMARANDPQLEAEMLSRLLVQLSDGTSVAAAPGATTAAPATTSETVQLPARARALPEQAGAALQVDDPLDRAWRRVGAALDRSGFTVEDRDRSLGVYYVRYVDPKLAGKEEPGFFARVFTGAKKEDLTGVRYQISLRDQGNTSIVSVLDSQGAAQNSESARNIVTLLVNELR